MVSEIQKMLYPRGVAVVGSVSSGKLGEVLTHRILGGGFQPVYNVNPKAQAVDGKVGYASISTIPEAVDLAVLACPAATVPQMLLDAGRAGVAAAVIISSGFSEAGEHELEEQVVAAARQAGVRYVGPNCAGIVNLENGLVATLETVPKPGRVSLLSQSGAIGGAFMDAADRANLGMAKFLSFGNGSDLNATLLLRYLAEDSDTDVICLYLENVREGRAFMETLAYATEKKPVIIIKSGRTLGGQRAAQSHTGAMAGSDTVYEAAFQKCGAIRATSVDEMIDLAKAFAANVGMKCGARRIGILTNSGGPGVLTADRCEMLGLPVCAPDESLKARLSGALPAFAGLSNPIDVTVEGNAAQYAAALDAMLSVYDAAIVIYVGTPYLLAAPIARAIAEVRKKHGKPVSAYFAVGTDMEEADRALSEAHIACYDSGERAAVGLNGVLRYTGEHGYLPSKMDDICNRTPKTTGNMALLESEAMLIMDEMGITVPKHFVAKNAEEAVAFAHTLGYPVCMKIVSRDILHKSDVGGVKLHIRDDETVRSSFAALRRICDGLDFSGVILYPMLKPGVEVILGLVRDATFGPVSVFGLGGIFTETLQDVSMMVAPLCLAEAHAMINAVKSVKLLKGARGTPPCDIDALAEMLVKLSELMFLHEEISEVDLNPVFAYEKGAMVADARMILKV
ncbi:MAG: acetate--CoA ligase family protein [Clostridia bacterium]